MKKIFISFLIAHCSFLIIQVGQAQVIYIPADFPTIQQGIDAANPGDTVLVLDGTYYEQINFFGKKPLMVASQFIMDGDISHISNTIINGSQPLNPDSASVVYFVSGEDTTSFLCGFTITGGTGTTIYSSDCWGIAREGGGIWISGSGAKIMNNHITNNQCSDIGRPNVESNIGGGIATECKQEEDDWIVIQDNVIDSNYLDSDTTAGCCTGAGIAIMNNCRISSNIIKNNVSKILVPTIWWSQGTGACVFSSDSLYKTAIINNNQFLYNINNSNNAFGGGMKAAGGMRYTISNNTFIGNRVESDISVTNCWGGGLEAGNFLEGSVISNNTFNENYSEKTYAGLMLYSTETTLDTVVIENNYFSSNVAESLGGALGSANCPFTLQNNIFSGNHAGNQGGAIFISNTNGIDSNHFATLINNSFYNNTAAVRGGAIYASLSKLLIFNCIFWQDSALIGKEIFLNNPNDTVEVAYSIIDPIHVYGNFKNGGGNIYEDPLFEGSGEYPFDLSAGSPCIDAGTPDTTGLNIPSRDFLGNWRIWDGDDNGTSIVDMGAFEFGSIPLEVEIPAAGNQQPAVISFPNPFTGFTTIEYELEHPAHVNLSIYNHLGHRVAVLVNEQQAIGNHQVIWNAEGLKSGIYFYRLITGKLCTGKMVMVR